MSLTTRLRLVSLSQQGEDRGAKILLRFQEEQDRQIDRERVGDSVCRLPRAQPEDLNPLGFSLSSLEPHYAATAYSSAKLSFAVSLAARYGEPRRDKEYAFTRLSMLIGPMLFVITRRRLVEPPGIAPGSSPFITRSFMSIVRASPDRTNIGMIDGRGKDRALIQPPVPDV